MTLLDAQSPKPPIKVWKYILLGVVLLLVGAIIYALFRNYPEERAVARFLTTLEQGKYKEAYQLWQPAASYSYQDFLHDWGEQGDYGKIRKYQILGSRAKGSQVLVTVSINDVQPPLEIAVDRETKGLAYSPF